MNSIMRLFGYEPVYMYDWDDGRGPIEYDSCYDSTDHQMWRPIHPRMRVAPPWAKKHYRKNKDNK